VGAHHPGASETGPYLVDHLLIPIKSTENHDDSIPTMMVLRLLLVALLFGIGTQSANACETEFGVHERPHEVANGALGSAPGYSAGIGPEQRCECPAAIANAEAVASESSKWLLAPYVEGADGAPYPSDLDAAAVAMRTRASSFIARRSELPPYLRSPRLLQ